MRKEQITVTNNSVCNSAENKGLEGKGMKRRLLHFKKRMVPAVSGALMGVMLMSTIRNRLRWDLLQGSLYFLLQA